MSIGRSWSVPLTTRDVDRSKLERPPHDTGCRSETVQLRLHDTGCRSETVQLRPHDTGCRSATLDRSIRRNWKRHRAIQQAHDLPEVTMSHSYPPSLKSNQPPLDPTNQGLDCSPAECEPRGLGDF